MFIIIRILEMLSRTFNRTAGTFKNFSFSEYKKLFDTKNPDVVNHPILILALEMLILSIVNKIKGKYNRSICEYIIKYT